MTLENRSAETLALHGGTWRADPVSGAVAVPTTDQPPTSSIPGHADRLFALDDIGTSTPCLQSHQDRTRRASPRRKAAAAALLLSSGLAGRRPIRC